MIYILGGAFILSILFNVVLEGLAILIVILITVLIGFFMEWQAKKSVEALQNLVHTYTTVIRDGVQTEVESKFLVPGDLIILETGDITPADARIVEHKGLAVKESILTGESVQTEKKLEVLASQTPISEQFNMVFKWTIISRGNGKAIVTNIGDQTAIGQINLLTQQAKKSITPLEKKLYQLSRWLIWLTLGITILIAITGFLQGKDLLLMIKTAIALAVAAIPEGLPVVATITLARGMLKLSKKKVIIKKLEAVETLGSTTIICTDKTGTLTENKMEVQKLSFHKYSISLKDLKKPQFLNEQKNSFPFKKLIDVGILCNTINTETEMEKGDSVEVALLNFAKNSGFDVWEIKQNHPEKFSIPFDTEKKLMITVNSNQDKYVVNVKGAPESVLHHCEHYLCEDSILPLKDPENWDLQAQDLAKEGLRVLSLAYKEVSEKPAEATLLKDLVFIGLVGFLDPPRKDIRDAIKTYKDAGIKVVMITGDHPETSRKIGEEIGLISPNSKPNSVLLGTSLEEQITRSKNHDGSLLNVAIFSRMLP
ncbi:MAG TPA: HAD-IC family P-type ATPase, partial [Gillisia sp.]|nr:HAD-IC family P-type ATPase [Gillisia sp.]